MSALNFLRISYNHPYPPSFIAVDALEYVGWDLFERIGRNKKVYGHFRYVEEQTADTADDIKDFLSLFNHHLRQGREPFYQNNIYNPDISCDEFIPRRRCEDSLQRFKCTRCHSA